MGKVLSVGLVLAWLLLPVTASGAEMTGRRVMELQKERQKSRTEVERQKVTLVDRGGDERTREARRYLKESGEDEYRGLFVFLGPADIRGTALLTWQHRDRDDDQWLYLPAKGRMQRITGGGETGYFMGTDFTYEDLKGEDLDGQQYVVLREDESGGTPCWVVEARPTGDGAGRRSAYGRRLLWIAKETLASLRIEYFDRRDKPLKVLTAEGWERIAGSVWRPGKLRMENLRSGHRTLVETVERALDRELADETFTERFVLKGKHLQ